MRYEHLIQVNDPHQTVLPVMDRSTLWLGLMLRAKRPDVFPLGPVSCQVIPHASEEGFSRRVDFGAFVVEDKVHVETLRQVRFEPKRTHGLSHVSLVITIENHPADDPDALFLRFVYQADQDDPETDGIRQQAWLANDRDMMRTLWRLSAQNDGLMS